nr:chemotaxis protein CheB [Halorhodospira abdelmalekii]
MVGVAASAGGLEALRELLRHLPEECDLAIIVAQHLSPHHRSILPELLAAEAKLTVCAAEDGALIVPGTVYVTPSNNDVIVEEGRIRLLPPPDRIMPKPSADRLFRSLAAERAESCAGVVLSGTGSDGAAGVRAIKAAGGVVFVQEPKTALYDGMPRAALDTGCADAVPTLAGIAERLCWLAAGALQAEEVITGGDALERIMQRVYRDRRMDLSAYREPTVQRRLHRRLVATGSPDLEAYERLLVEDESEMDRLCRELLISVTEFFRDRPAFQALQRVLESMVQHRTCGHELRVWVPGCATGEEAYSIGILLAEALGEQRSNYSIQIFATDLDEEALNEARLGLYPAGAVHDLPRHLVEKYFTREAGQVRVVKLLREMMVFARQDLLNDPPFTRLDLISCRNVLIYMRPETQHRLLELFHYALRQSGRLFLGRAEGVSGRDYLYTPLDSTQRLYQRRSDVQSMQPHFGGGQRRHGGTAVGAGGAQAGRRKSQQGLIERVAEATMQAYAPPSVLVDASGTVVRSDRASPYMGLPDGEINLGAQSMVCEELRSDFVTLLARSHREGCVQEGSPVAVAGMDHRVRLRVVPVSGAGSGDAVHYLVFFEPVAVAIDPQFAIADADDAAQRVIEVLQAELTATREHLNIITEELERANQELQSTNEELQSSNEELQSTNEELETSNEELQSTNEELTTVNEELNRRSEELSAAYDDLNNVMDSLGDPLLVLDDQLCIKQINSAARCFFGLEGERLGMPITMISTKLGVDGLVERVQRVLRQGAPQEEQIDVAGEGFLLRLHPYRDHHGRICGCVLFMVNQSGVIRAEQGLRETQARLVGVLRHAPLLAAFTAEDGRFRFVNPAFERFFQLDPGAALDSVPHEVLPAEAADELLAGDHEARETLGSSVVERSLTVNGRERRLWIYRIPILVDPDSGELDIVCTLALEVTEWWQAVSQARLQAQALDSASEGMVLTDATADDHPIIYCNRAFTELTGYTADEIYGENCRILQGPETDADAKVVLRDALQRQEAVEVTLINYRKDGSTFPNHLRITPIRDEQGQVTHYLGIQTDVSAAEKARHELLQAKAEAEAASLAKTEFLSSMSHELRTPLNAILGFTQLLRGDGEPDAETRQRYYQHVLHAGWFLRDLVNEVLDLARIEAGQLAVHPEPRALAPLIEQCIAFVWADSQASEIKIETQLDEAAWVEVDPVRARQIFTNLLSNAVKYNRRGGAVTLTVRCEESGWVTVDVTDTGYGIDAERQQRLFRPFERLGQERSTIEGSGIGLVVSQHLAQLMGGRLRLHRSAPGEGSTFRLQLPRAAPPALRSEPERPAAGSPGQSPGQSPRTGPSAAVGSTAEAGAGAAAEGTTEPLIRVLYVEDNELNMTLVRGLIRRRSNVELIEAATGAEGIAAAQREALDLILLDLHLPDMTGFDIMAALRESGAADGIPVVAVSADALEQQQERARREGFSEYLVKPFRLEDLERLLVVAREPGV